MIIHMMLLYPKPEATTAELDAVCERVKALQNKIPGILAVQAGANRNTQNQGYTYGCILTFLDDAHFQAYFPHPEHKAVSAELRRLSVHLTNFDLESENKGD